MKALTERADLADWFRNGPNEGEPCEVAATFSLNERWEFDPDDFRGAVDALVSKRSHDRHP